MWLTCISEARNMSAIFIWDFRQFSINLFLSDNLLQHKFIYIYELNHPFLTLCFLNYIDWDEIFLNYLYRAENFRIGHTFDFLLKPFCLGYSKEKSKTGFKNKESLSRFCILILNGAQNFKFMGFIYATLIGWILFTFQDT